LIFFLSINAFAQQDTIFFNYKWLKTTRDSALYFRISEKTDAQYFVKDFYMNGNLQMEGIYSSLEPEIRNGYFIWYYESGQKYAEGKYLHGKRDGIWTFWYPDGVKKEELEFKAEQDYYTVKWESKRVKASRELLEKARRKKDRRKISEALELLSEAIQHHSYSADLFFERAMIFCGANRNEECCRDLVQARAFEFYDTILLNEQLEIFCPEKLKK
jgi:hypothetical protein